MSDSTLTGNAPVRRNITRKNVIIGLLLLLFVLIALWCHGRPGSELGLLGFTPLVALAILSLIGVDIVLAVISSIIIAMIMTSTRHALQFCLETLVRSPGRGYQTADGN